MKGGIVLKSYGKNLSMVNATNLTSICCVYKEKFVKNVSYLKNVVSIQIQKVETFDSDSEIINLISNKSFRHYNP